MAKYRIILSNTAGEQIELLPKTYSFTDELNKESTAKLSLDYKSLTEIADIYNISVLAMFTTSIRYLWIERTDNLNNYQKIFNGILTGYSVSPDVQGDKTVNIDAIDYFGALTRRRTVKSRIFTGVDAGLIAWTLISENQTSDSPYSDFGITQGTHPTTKNRDRTYKFDNIKDSIIALSNNNLKDGFDFDIDTTKNFNVYYPTKGSNKFNVIFDEKTLSSWSYKKPLFLGLTNRVYVLGAGENEDLLYTQRDASNTYKTDWKLLEDVQSEKEIIELTTLQDKGDLTLTQKQTPIIEFSAEHYDTLIQWSDYGIGDSIKVNFPDLGILNESKRVLKRDFSMDTTKSIGVIKVQLK